MRSATSSQPFAPQSSETLNNLHLNLNGNITTEINWFHLLTKICVFKSNQILDCLLFSIFKKISQLTPPLFGSLLGPYVHKFQNIILEKLNIYNDGQTLIILSEFLCSIIKYQPGYFQTLAGIKKDTQANGTSLTFIEEEPSLIKALFTLLGKLKAQERVCSTCFYLCFLQRF